LNAEPPHRPGDRSAPEEGYDIELAPVGLLVAASDGRVIATNQAWSELSNRSGPDSTGQGFLAALAPAERPRCQDDLRQVALGTDQVIGDYHLEAGSIRRRTRWWLRPHNRNGVPLVLMAVGDFTTSAITSSKPP
jgi:PAS domain-containing protein